MGCCPDLRLNKRRRQVSASLCPSAAAGPSLGNSVYVIRELRATFAHRAPVPMAPGCWANRSLREHCLNSALDRRDDQAVGTSLVVR